MKSTKLSSITLAVVTASTGLVQAGDVYITGSTAFRTQAHNGIIASLGGAGVTEYAYVNANGNTIANTNQAIFKGTLNGNAVTVYTSWSGSVAGVRDVVLNGTRTVNYLASSTTVSTGGSTVASLGTNAQSSDIAFSDNLQSNTYFQEPVLTSAQVGIIPFKWFASFGSSANFDNMTQLHAQKLWADGFLPLAVFTGLNADQTKRVFATGRDSGSGSRVIAFAESGVGIFNSSIIQYNPVFSGTAISSIAANFPPISAIAPAPAYTSAEGGHSSGNSLSRSLRYSWNASGYTPSNRNGGSFVTYLGGSDWGQATAPHDPLTTQGAGPARELNWNGVPYSFSNVAEGKYTFWGYQYVLYKDDLATTKPQGEEVALSVIDFLTNLPATLPGDQATAVTLNIADMKVSRTEDGGIVSPNY